MAKNVNIILTIMGTGTAIAGLGTFLFQSSKLTEISYAEFAKPLALIGILLCFSTLFWMKKKSTDLGGDERMQRLSEHGLAYSWLFTMTIATAMTVNSIFGWYKIHGTLALLAVMMAMGVSGNFFVIYFSQQGDIE